MTLRPCTQPAEAGLLAQTGQGLAHLAHPSAAIPATCSYARSSASHMGKQDVGTSTGIYGSPHKRAAGLERRRIMSSWQSDRKVAPESVTPVAWCIPAPALSSSARGFGLFPQGSKAVRRKNPQATVLKVIVEPCAHLNPAHALNACHPEVPLKLGRRALVFVPGLQAGQ